MTIMQDWLIQQAMCNPAKYSELAWHSMKTAAYLSIDGIQSGNRVGVLTFSDEIMIHALRMLGAIYVPFNLRLTPKEMLWQAQSAKCDFIFCDKHTSKQAKIFADNGFTVLTDGYNLPYTYIFRDENAPYFDVEPFVEKSISLDDEVAIIFTSGTTGKPKGVVLTHNNFFYSAMASAYRIGHLPDDKWLCVLPLYHVGGLSILIRAVLYGITVDLRPKFDVDEINHALTHDDITLVSLVPTMLYRLLEARKEPWSPKLRLVLLGGAAASPELMQRCIDEGIPVATTYGMTETASQIATTLPGDAVRKPGSVGKPLMFTQVRIVDENDNDVPTGGYGEIIVKGPTVMKAYYGDPEATQKALRDGWLHTGDIGYLDDEGDLFLVQRRSDLIVSGGENVYPAEVEAALRKHSAIKEVAVVGVEDAEWGQKVAAAIVVREGHSLTEQAVEQHARQHLAGYKIPRLVKFVDALPQTASGKIQRSGIIDLFLNHRDTEDTESQCQ